MINTNGVQVAKEVVIFKEILSSKTANFWVAIALMSSYMLCFLTCLAQKVFNTSDSYSFSELIVLCFFNVEG